MIKVQRLAALVALFLASHTLLITAQTEPGGVNCTVCAGGTVKKINDILQKLCALETRVCVVDGCDISETFSKACQIEVQLEVLSFLLEQCIDPPQFDSTQTTGDDCLDLEAKVCNISDYLELLIQEFQLLP